MDCPVCKNAMITLELADVEIDHCLDCGGIWLDAGELELLLANAEQAERLIHSFKINNQSTEKKRKCPICLKKMEKIIVTAAVHPLLIDRCTKGDGLWFDKGELKDILETATFDEQNKIVQLLTDIFVSERKNN
jgi:Zn-finger nucleic acid-binding protein